VLTAAAGGNSAFGRGVFTWALLDALKNGDRNGTIELSVPSAHVRIR
jgi:hypothetical protein